MKRLSKGVGGLDHILNSSLTPESAYFLRGGSRRPRRLLILNLGEDTIQGFYYAKSIPENDLKSWLGRW